jgi:hypothetical protein
MALPPIIANNPLVKLFRTNDAENKNLGGKTAAEPPSAGTPRDVVEISEAAKNKLDSVKQKAAEDDRQAHKVAVNTRDILQNDQTQTLGLDSDFAS